MTTEKPRWQYRYDNFQRAFLLLREAITLSETRELSALEKEGLIQRFEYTWELAWKTLKDFLEAEGIILETVTPAATLKAAFAARIIHDGELWMKALDARNLMSHTYNLKTFEKIATAIRKEYLPLLEKLYQDLGSKISSGSWHG
jgi:nucleotidyltransferase substrate binding protein (TIGR01987 family)